MTGIICFFVFTFTSRVKHDLKNNKNNKTLAKEIDVKTDDLKMKI